MNSSFEALTLPNINNSKELEQHLRDWIACNHFTVYVEFADALRARTLFYIYIYDSFLTADNMCYWITLEISIANSANSFKCTVKNHQTSTKSVTWERKWAHVFQWAVQHLTQFEV